MKNPRARRRFSATRDPSSLLYVRDGQPAGHVERIGKVPIVTLNKRANEKAAQGSRGGLRTKTSAGWDQFAVVSLATSALMTSNSLSSPPAMLTSVTYLPFTITVGVPEIL